MASTVLPNGIIVPEKFSRDWYADLYHNWQELDNLLGGGGGSVNDGTLTIQKNGDTVGTFSANQSTDETVNIEVPTATSELTNDSGFITGVSWNDVTDKPTFATVATSGSYNDLSNKPTIPTVNDGTLTIQQNGTTVDTFTANSSTDKTVNISVPTKTSDLNNDSGFITGVAWNDVTNKPSFATVATSGSYTDLSDKPTIPTTTSDLTNDSGFLTLESLSANSIPFHNSYPRCKYLGTSITDAQNTAIKNRTYDDLFVGDYWTIGGINWRIVAIDYYYNVGDTNFDKGNVIVMPDTVLYNAQMNTTNTTAGAYHGSLMRTQNLNNARTIARNAFGSHLANHRIILANSVDSSGPNDWAWHDSDGVELPNEVQIYGTRVWGSALKGYDVATQKQQFPLLALAPQFVNTRQNYWLQDVSSYSVSSGAVSGYFAIVTYDGYAGFNIASASCGVRPSVALSYI